MRKILFTVLSVVILLGAAAALVPSMIDWSAYKDPAIKAIESATGYVVRFDGPIAVRVLPYPAVRLRAVDIRQHEIQRGAGHFRAEGVSASLALLPLLTGRVQVRDIMLENPDAQIVILENGEFDVPPQVGKMLGYRSALESQKEDVSIKEARISGAPSAHISVDSFSIRGGRIRLADQRDGSVKVFEKLTLDLSLADLKGPYRADATGLYNGVGFEMKGRVGAIRDVAADTPIQIDAKFPDFRTRAAFEGAFSRRAEGDVQGTLKIAGPRVPELIKKIAAIDLPVSSGDLDFSALVSATPLNVVLDRMVLSYGRSKIAGIVKIRLKDKDFPKPLIHARLTSDEVVDARLFLGAGPKQHVVGPGGEALKKADKADAVPMKAVSKKLPVDLDIEWKTKGLQLGREALRDAAFVITAEKDQIRGRLSAAQVPGGGKLDFSVWPGEGQAVMIEGEMTIKDTAKFVDAGLGLPFPAGLNREGFQDVSFKTRAKLDPARGLFFETGTASLPQGAVSFGGSSYETGRKPPRVDLTIGAKMLDLDALMTPQKEKARDPKAQAVPAVGTPLGQTIKHAGQQVKLPFDLSLSGSFGALTLAGYKMREVELVADLAASGLRVEALKIGDVTGAEVEGHGKVADLSAMTGIDAKINITASDGGPLVQKWMPAYAGGWPDKKPLRFTLSYQGNLDKADLSVKGQALGLGVDLAGPVTDPLAQPAFNELTIGVSADRAVSAIRLLQPGFKGGPSLQGPMKLRATTSVKDKYYSFKNVSGQVGAMTVKGDVTADLRGNRPVISGGLDLGDVPLDALMGVESGPSGSSGASVSSGAGVKNAGGRWSSAPIDTAWMRAFDADFAVTASRVTYHLWSLADTGMGLNLKSGRLNVEDARGKLFGGTLAASARIEAPSTGAGMNITGGIDFANVNARSLSNALMNKNMNRLDGVVGMKIDIAAAGVSPAQIVSSLSGSASSQGQNVTVNGIDVARLVSWLATDLKPSTTIDGLMGSFMGTGSTVFDTHTGLYTIRNGQIALDQMMFDGVQARMDTVGGIDLPAWRVDTKTTLKIKNADNVPPVTFTLQGPLDRPAQNMVGNLFENYLQRELGKQVNKLIDKKLGSKLNDLGLGGLLGAPTEQPAPAPGPDLPPDTAPTPEKIKPEDVLIDVLKGLGR